MALRNAFGELGLDATLQRLVAVLERWRVPAADANDRMRVITDTASTILSYNYTYYYGHAGGYPGYYATGLLGSMDPREVHAQTSQVNFNQVVQQRWVTI